MCNHIVGIIENKLLYINEWKELEKIQIKAIDFWYKNIDDAIRYNIPEPKKNIKFQYCPFCGEKL